MTQGVHIIAGLATVPILLAKLWAVIPQLFERPAVRSLAHGLERIGLALLVGGGLFVIATGILNIQLWYPFNFSFVPAHYWASFVFLAALVLHVVTKIGVARRALSERGVVAPLRDGLAETRPEQPATDLHTSAPADPVPPTVTRRLLLGTVGAGSVGLAVMGAGQVVGGPLRDLALLAPRGESFGDGPNDFQVNKPFDAVGIEQKAIDNWSLALNVDGEERMTLTRDELLALEQVTEDLPIACVEGWTTTQRWTGVRLSALAEAAGARDADTVEARSLQPRGVFRRATLARNQIEDPRSLLALQVNGEDLSLDHGFPARVIVPALPGVHNTKWVAVLDFRSSA